MKKSVWLLLCLFTASISYSQTIMLPNVDKTRGATIMKALEQRKSTRQLSSKELSLQDIGDLLWAANGVNRADGKRTAPSARNRQDVTLFLARKDGAYRYDHKAHALVKVTNEDITESDPLSVILVANTDDAMTGVDVGVVSQNISLFCAAVDLATVCRGMMDKVKISKALKLEKNEVPWINHPVGYFR